MKKLMIAAAAAAMIGSVFADAQVYDMKLSVKTTACKKGKFTKALEDLQWFPNYSKGDEVSFRKQASLTIAGVIWGCDCTTIADPDWRDYGTVTKTGLDTIGGYAFWNATATPAVPLQIPYVRFDWLLLNRIDQMKSVEGTWLLGDPIADEACFFIGAGFGTVKNNTANECASYITSMKGSFAGFVQGGVGGDDGCVFCGAIGYSCLVANFCECDTHAGVDTTAMTAAYGTWTLKYNSSASKKLKTKYYITQAMSFKGKKLAAVNDALLAAYTAIVGKSLKADSEAEIEEGESSNEGEPVDWSTLEDDYYVALFDLDEDEDDVEDYKPQKAADVIEGYAETAQAIADTIAYVLTGEEPEPDPEHNEEEK